MLWGIIWIVLMSPFHGSIKPELSEDDIITSMKSRDDQIRPSDEQCAELKELHDSVVQGIQKAQQSGGDSDFITESDPAENAQILDFHTIGSYTRNCLLKDSLKVGFIATLVLENLLLRKL